MTSLKPEFIAQHRLADRLAEPHLAHHDEPRTQARRFLHRVLTKSYNVTIGLEWQGSVAARLGVERRHPFLDRRLVEFVVAIPDDDRVPLGLKKQLMRNALSTELPEVVRLRQMKVTFDELWQVLVNDRDFRQEAEGIAAASLLEANNVVQKGEVMHMLARAVEGDDRATSPLFKFIESELWLRNA